MKSAQAFAAFTPTFWVMSASFTGLFITGWNRGQIPEKKIESNLMFRGKRSVLPIDEALWFFAKDAVKL